MFLKLDDAVSASLAMAKKDISGCVPSVVFSAHNHLTIVYYCRLPTKLGGGNVFTGVCLITGGVV